MGITLLVPVLELVPLPLIVIATSLALKRGHGPGRLLQAIGATLVLVINVFELVCLNVRVGLLRHLPFDHAHSAWLWLGLYGGRIVLEFLGWLGFGIGMLIAVTHKPRNAGNSPAPETAR